MATPVEMPKLGNSVEECLLNRWVKGKGDVVAEGEVVVEIETDKTNFEVTAPVRGTILETFFPEGALVPVFETLFVIGHAGESVEKYRPAAGSMVQPAGSRLQAPGTMQESVTAHREAVGPGPEPEANSLKPAVSVWSPRARRFADEHDFHPRLTTGSGPGGRVLEEDVRRAYEKRDSSARDTKPIGGTNIRDTIARRMRESLASTAQYTLNASADASALLAARGRFKTSRDMSEVTINDLVCFCTIKALRHSPELNAEYIGGRIVMHDAVNLGFATDTPRGLMVPVLRNAERLTLAELSAGMKALAGQAIAGRIGADALSGATFTVSNLGGLGIESFTPVINPPQVAILGVGSIQLRPVRRSGTVEFADVLGLSLTCDHQVIDGAPGARFLQTLKQQLESFNDA